MNNTEMKIAKLIKKQEIETKRREKINKVLQNKFNRICKKIDLKLNRISKIPKEKKKIYNKKYYSKKKVNLGDNALVYKITDIDETEVYYGSTSKTLSDRWAQHVSRHKQFINGKKTSNFSLFELFNKYGVDNCKIILV